MFNICRRYTVCSKLPGRLGVYLPSAGRLAEGWDTATQTQSCDDSTVVDVPKLSWPTHQLQPFKTMHPSRNIVTLGCNVTLESSATKDPANFTARCASLYPSHVNGSKGKDGKAFMARHHVWEETYNKDEGKVCTCLRGSWRQAPKPVIYTASGTDADKPSGRRLTVRGNAKLYA